MIHKSRLFLPYLAVIMGLSLSLSLSVPASAMQALSDDDLGGVAGTSGISFFGTGMDMVVQFDKFHLYLSPASVPRTSSFLIVPKTESQTLFPDPGPGYHGIAAGMCGSSTDPSVPISFDAIGFTLDIHHGAIAGDGRLKPEAVTLSMLASGSFEAHWTWELVQFVTDAGAGIPYDVFGFHVGPWTWAHSHGDWGDDTPAFMHLYVSPLEHYEDTAFWDSAMGPWQGWTAAQIRSSQGIGGELGLTIGGGELNFRGFGGQEAKGTSIMWAGSVMDKPYYEPANPAAFGAGHPAEGWVFPNWQVHDYSAGKYYSPDMEDWYIAGRAVQGVHHQRTYTRSGYEYHDPVANRTLDMDFYVQSRIGQTSNTMPMRIEMASSEPAAGVIDTYLVMYTSGHYRRSVYYPDARNSSMGTSTGAVVAPVAGGVMKDYILGDIRVGETKGVPEGETIPGSSPGAPDWPESLGSWSINDISVEYAKVVIPGERNLVYEISAGSEDFLIPNTDYYGEQMAFAGDLSPTTVNRNMVIAGCFNGAEDSWGNRTTPWVHNRPDRVITSDFWNN